METTRPPGFPGNPPARMPRAPTPARSPPPRPLRCGEIAFRPTHDVGPHKQCMSGLNHAAYGLPVNASRPGSPQAHASLGSGWRPTLAGWDWIPTGFRIRFRRLRHVILSPLTGLSRHTRWCKTRDRREASQSGRISATDAVGQGPTELGHPIQDVARDQRPGAWRKEREDDVDEQLRVSLSTNEDRELFNRHLDDCSTKRSIGQEAAFLLGVEVGRLITTAVESGGAA